MESCSTLAESIEMLAEVLFMVAFVLFLLWGLGGFDKKKGKQ